MNIFNRLALSTTFAFAACTEAPETPRNQDHFVQAIPGQDLTAIPADIINAFVAKPSRILAPTAGNLRCPPNQIHLAPLLDLPQDYCGYILYNPPSNNGDLYFTYDADKLNKEKLTPRPDLKIDSVDIKTNKITLSKTEIVGDANTGYNKKTTKYEGTIISIRTYDGCVKYAVRLNETEELIEVGRD